MEIGMGTALSCGQLARALETDLRSVVPKYLEQGKVLTEQVRDFLGELAPWRNEGAHAGRVERAVAQPLRDRLLGIGSEGVLTRLSRVRVKA